MYLGLTLNATEEGPDISVFCLYGITAFSLPTLPPVLS